MRYGVFIQSDGVPLSQKRPSQSSTQLTALRRDHSHPLSLPKATPTNIPRWSTLRRKNKQPNRFTQSSLNPQQSPIFPRISSALNTCPNPSHPQLSIPPIPSRSSLSNFQLTTHYLYFISEICCGSSSLVPISRPTRPIRGYPFFRLSD